MRNFICFFAGSICLKGYINLHRYLQTFLTQQFNLKSFFSRNLFLVFPPKGGKIRKIIPTVIHQSCQPRPLLFFPGSSQPGGEKKNYPKNPNKMVQNRIILSFFLSFGWSLRQDSLNHHFGLQKVGRYSLSMAAIS